MNLALRNRISGLHKLSVYAVVTIAFACVAFGGGVGPIMGTIFVIALVGSWFADTANVFDASSARWWNALILAFVAVTAVQLFATDESVISAAIRFVLLLTVTKLFGRFAHRDDLQIYALSFLMFAAATAVNEGLTYGILFGLYVIAGTFSLALFHLDIELDEQQTSLGSQRMPFDRQYMAVLGAISLVIFASSLIIFFTFPRVGLGFFVSKSRDHMSMTGFSESVELGSHGKIRDNPQVVMRVEFPDGRPDGYETLHWRTITFDKYNGTSWSRTLEDSERTLPRRGREFLFGQLHREWRQGISKKAEPERLSIYLEPLGTNLLPRLWPTGTVELGSESVRIPWDPNSGDVTVDAYGDIRHTLESEVGVPYRITVMGRPDRQLLRDQTYQADHRGPDPRYLQLPEMSKRFVTLANDVTDTADTPYEKAEAVADYMQQNFSYTTDLPEVDADAPIDSFVFDTKRGHCEYFATTSVLMLRASGVPARLVNGFLGGRWNDVGDYLGVRQGDAHSWIEVWVPNFGWAPVDPTPAADVLPVKPNPFVAWYRNVYDTARLNWMKWVIEYNLESQIELFKKMGKALSPKSSLFSKSGQKDSADDGESSLNLRQVLLWLGLIGGLAGSFFTSRRWMLRRRRALVALAVVGWPAAMALWLMYLRGFDASWGGVGALAGGLGVALGVIMGAFARQTDASRLAEFFATIERAGAHAGVERQADEGPGAYLNRLARAFPRASGELAAFRQRYLAARFGGREPGAKQMAGLAELVQSIRKRVRRSA